MKRGAQPRRDVYTECERHQVGLVAMKPFACGFIYDVKVRDRMEQAAKWEEIE